MPRPSFRSLATLLLVGPTLVLLLPAPLASAAAGTVDTVTMVSESGDYIGGGQSRAWYTGSGSVGVQGTLAGGVSVSVSGGPSGDDFSLGFAAPSGESLQVGTYEDAERLPFRSAGHPGIDVSGDGRGCNTISGRFEVLEASADLSRLWIVYEQHCEGGQAALFGEVRIGLDAQTDVLTVPGRVHWPEQYPGTSGRVVPVTVVNRGTSTATVGTPAVAGDEAFSVSYENCASLAPGATCTVYVAFVPPSAGLHEAVLSVDAGQAGLWQVPLRGRGSAGTTSWQMQSDAGDYIGAGQSYSYDPRNAVISAQGSESYVSFAVDSGNDWWYADFEADRGRLLLPGTTFKGAARYPFNASSQPGLDVSGSGRGCNQLTGEFTVEHAVFEGGEMREIAIRFEQHCEGAGPALRGLLRWRVGASDGSEPDPVDDTAPGAVSGLGARGLIGAATLSWDDPADADWVRTVVRGRRGGTAPTAVSGGWSAYEGSEGRALVEDLDPGHDYSFSVFPIDYAGNTGDPRSVTVRSTTLSLAARDRVRTGDTVRLRGSLVRSTDGSPLTDTTVLVYGRRASGGAWARLGTATTRSDGSYVFVRTLSRATEFSVRFGGADTDLGDVSNRDLVRVRR